MLTRNQFLRSLVGVGVGAVGVAVIAGCGGDDGGSPDAPAAVCTTPSASISGNHGHVLTVSLTDVNAALDKTYDIMGSAAHTHSVTVTAAQFGQIKTSQTLMLTTTTTNGHSHPITVQCIS